MPYSLLPTLLLQILVVGYTPGPANIYSLAMSLRHGWKQSMVMWLGLMTGFSIAVTLMAVFTHFIAMAFGQYVGYLKYVGAAYLRAAVCVGSSPSMAVKWMSFLPLLWFFVHYISYFTDSISDYACLSIIVDLHM